MSGIPTEAYAVSLKNKDELIKSSSGGAFTALSDEFLKNGDAVVCTVYNYEKKTAEFQFVMNTAERDSARGSKYMQSAPGNIYRESVDWLRKNPQKRIFFIGTGCQAAGFRKFIKLHKLDDRVVIADIICHGVPSPLIWKEYASHLERTNNGKISHLQFKDKRNGWLHPTAFVKINGKEIPIKPYVRVFYNKCALRPSCHKCPYATTERETDITIGDYWGIENVMPDFYNEKGISLVLIHTEKGAEIFDLIKKDLDCKKSNVTECLQPNLKSPTEKSTKREEFWKDFQEKGISFIMKKYGEVSFASKVRSKIKRLFK